MLRPAGVRVTRWAGVVTSFGIRLYINGSPTCTFCANTTAVNPTSKQFVLYDPTTVLRPGDVVRFTALEGTGMGVFLSSIVRTFQWLNPVPHGSLQLEEESE
ncbi:hypothetical protein ZHAS_00015860 [Anopheles sinensis]|uniref:CBM39 domain-containing protein n=1 Tax=Anopheles sinensis TaxID=74873 RepID=A0A084WC43_ANOSI|nr:hypothetical protein ZHAS_00015860 [Anopheles sinensis]